MEDNIKKNADKIIADSKLYDHPPIFSFFLGMNEKEGPEAEAKHLKSVIDGFMIKHKRSPEEDAYILKRCFEVKESVLPYRESLAKLKPDSLYDANFHDGKLIINEKNTVELEKQKSELLKKEHLKMVSGGFIANFIHNFKAAENLVNIKVIDIDIKFGSNLKEVDNLLINKLEENISNVGNIVNDTKLLKDKLAVNKVEDTSKAAAIVKDAETVQKAQKGGTIKDFNEMTKTLNDIYRCNVQTINANKSFKISKDTFDEFANLGINLSKVNDLFLVKLVSGEITSSVTTDIIGKGGIKEEREMSYRLSGTLNKPEIKIRFNENKTLDISHKTEIKRSVKLDKGLKQKTSKSLKIA